MVDIRIAQEILTHFVNKPFGKIIQTIWGGDIKICPQYYEGQFILFTCCHKNSIYHRMVQI